MSEAHILTIRDLLFTAESRVLLNIPHLALPAEGISVILGPNGAGKSVLLRLMHGILPLQQGEVTFARAGLRQAMVFQKPVLLRRTVAANISFALKASGQSQGRLGELLEASGLAAQARQPARSLSGGEQQRLALVRALATSPDILFLDEPTASLDPAATLRIEEMIRLARDQGRKIVMVTHNLSQARRLASDLSILDGGQIAETGPADQVFEAPRTRQTTQFLNGL